MPSVVVVGGFFGDEGKGKIISYITLTEKFDVAVRGGVGPNAGHTVVHGGMTYKLRMLPSAVASPPTRLMIGPGVLIDPTVLLDEIQKYSVGSRVLVDRNCTLIEEKHIYADRSDHLRGKIGTTGTGTGPANSERVLRNAKTVMTHQELVKMTGNVSDEVNQYLDDGKRVLVEGTQGTFLSLYHGTYPFVTSKDVTASAICSDVGIGPKRVDEILVVFKAFTTRVGEGPLEGELPIEEIERRGLTERGTVTGRRRRIAPFDFRLARVAAVLNSATNLAITKLDVLFPETSGLRDFDSLTKRAIKFIEEVESRVGVKVSLIGTGPELSEVIHRKEVA